MTQVAEGSGGVQLGLMGDELHDPLAAAGDGDLLARLGALHVVAKWLRKSWAPTVTSAGSAGVELAGRLSNPGLLRELRSLLSPMR